MFRLELRFFTAFLNSSAPLETNRRPPMVLSTEPVHFISGELLELTSPVTIAQRSNASAAFKKSRNILSAQLVQWVVVGTESSGSRGTLETRRSVRDLIIAR